MSQTIEHIVLFKIKDSTDPSNITSMITDLNSLSSLDQVLHLSAGPILRNKSSNFKFTHLLHSRYKSKSDLGSYSAHPDHQSVVKQKVLPICEDIMAVDWVSEDLEGEMRVKPGAALRVSLVKLKEGFGESEKGEILGMIGGIKGKFGLIDQISFGENFSPARAKGFSIASIAVFPGLSELNALDENVEVVEEQKEKVRGLLESVIVVDYVIPTLSSQSANL
ncbi:hypothetical protein GIB67_041533 [Kingdonia uniflora]|uniref:Stress-response A/B barrel domain-containing protein n=1 Tax=Kingdonia uniflora TaxID=39325 RepID=A0A7J7MQM1_9MAGN|nr:hypothetical protein GIB67_041533 [Kingdonia uniflora]